MAADSRIGTWIKRERERMRWTQQQLADRIEVDRKTVDNWENHRSQPRSSIGALEAAFGSAAPGSPEDGQILSPRARKVLREELGDDDYRRVVGIAEQTLRRRPPVTPGEEAAQDPQPAHPRGA